MSTICSNCGVSFNADNSNFTRTTLRLSTGINLELQVQPGYCSLLMLVFCSDLLKLSSLLMRCTLANRVFHRNELRESTGGEISQNEHVKSTESSEGRPVQSCSNQLVVKPVYLVQNLEKSTAASDSILETV